jgi:hypothetical protein
VSKEWHLGIDPLGKCQSKKGLAWIFQSEIRIHHPFGDCDVAPEEEKKI